MKRLIFLVACFLAAFGCRTTERVAGSETSESVDPGAKGMVWQQAVRQAQQEQAALQNVALSADQEIAKQLALNSESFRKLGNQNFLMVFAKDSNIAEDDRRSEKPESKNLKFTPDFEDPNNPKALQFYERPIQFRFVANPLVNCKQLISKNDFSRAINKDVFNRVPATDQANLMCGYVKFAPVNDRPANRAAGDLAEANIYLTSDYRPYALDVSTYTTKRTTNRVTLNTDPDFGVSSAVDLFPYDMPNLYSLSRMRAQGISSVTVTPVASLKLPDDPYVRKKLSDAGLSGDPCKGAGALQISYRDRMGLGTQVVGWCKGSAWPTMIENQKALSVLVPKKLG
jgi:hypothetical protein